MLLVLWNGPLLAVLGIIDEHASYDYLGHIFISKWLSAMPNICDARPRRRRLAEFD